MTYFTSILKYFIAVLCKNLITNQDRNSKCIISLSEMLLKLFRLSPMWRKIKVLTK